MNCIMKLNALWVATLVAMGIFIPLLQGVPLSENGTLPFTTSDHDSPTLPEQKILARNSTTIIKEGNASQIIEALGLLSGIDKDENTSDKNIGAIEIQINYITINMTELQTEGSEYDPDLDTDDDDEEIDDFGMIGTSDEEKYISLADFFNEKDSIENNDAQENDPKNLLINLEELDDMANELGSWAFCIKIYEGIINGTTPVTEAAKKESIMIDGSKAFRFIGQCKLLFSLLLQTFDTLDGNQQTLKAESLPAVSYDELPHSTPNPNTVATEEENVAGLAVGELPTELLHEYAVDVPSASLSYAVHPLTGSNDDDQAELARRWTAATGERLYSKYPGLWAVETRENSGVDHAEIISAKDETPMNESKDDNTKSYAVGTPVNESKDDNTESFTVGLIVITFFGSIILASFLFGVVCENIRQGRITRNKQFRMERDTPIQGFFLQLQKNHVKECLAKV